MRGHFLLCLIISAGTVAFGDFLGTPTWAQSIEQSERWDASRVPIGRELADQLAATGFLHKTYSNSRGYEITFIDLHQDCGITTSLEYFPNFEPGTLINDIALLGKRIYQYQIILEALGRWDNVAKFQLIQLTDKYHALVKIANDDTRGSDKVRSAAPYLIQANDISKEIARSVGVSYEDGNSDGCERAGFEDSVEVGFEIKPKPKAAFYILEADFDQCKQVIKDTYSLDDCDLWKRLQPSNEKYSGNYMLLVIWEDGTAKKDKFSALGREIKTITIEK